MTFGISGSTSTYKSKYGAEALKNQQTRRPVSGNDSVTVKHKIKHKNNSGSAAGPILALITGAAAVAYAIKKPEKMGELAHKAWNGIKTCGTKIKDTAVKGAKGIAGTVKKGFASAKNNVTTTYGNVTEGVKKGWQNLAK